MFGFGSYIEHGLKIRWPAAAPMPGKVPGWSANAACTTSATNEALMALNSLSEL